ncbi:PREDICTED: apolipoprotein C-III [Aptenodytes forsteri]|uniref:apolipoprotein C-III n=1 Tax=Aptenodytes forsteri TaxID=9233 RepID=UPI0009049FB9|nr:PREDICTED: apolipoprotein C-III [Aptenodytes forsteri]
MARTPQLRDVAPAWCQRALDQSWDPWADAPGEPEALVRKVQEYAQKATAMAKTAFSVVQESEVAQQARRWLADNTDRAKQRLAWLKEQIAELWKQMPAA